MRPVKDNQFKFLRDTMRKISDYTYMRFAVVALLALAGIIWAPAGRAATPEQTMDAIARRLQGAGSIDAAFSMTGAQGAAKGTLLTKGKKFTVSSGGHTVWYDGRDMWAYSPASKEVTVWTPTASELAESNPLLYLTSYRDYNVKAGASAGSVVLTPKKRGGVKSVEVTFSGSGANATVKQIKVAMSGGTTTVNVTSLRLNTNPSDASFRFNTSKYPGVKVTDLR